jgi:hypothetical protein
VQLSEACTYDLLGDDNVWPGQAHVENKLHERAITGGNDMT